MQYLIKTIWGNRLIDFTNIDYNKIIENLRIDGFDGFTIIYFIYFSYLQNFTTLEILKNIYSFSPLNSRLNQNINLLEFIYLTAFNNKFGNILQSYDIIKFLENKIKRNKNFDLYKIFYRNYFYYTQSKYKKIIITNNIINKTNKLLGNKFYCNYALLTIKEKIFLRNIFYSIYIHKNNYIKIHPIIFNYDMYKLFATQLYKISNIKNSIRIIVGESFNKLGLLLDLYSKTNSYYIPFSKNIYDNDNFTISKKYKYLTYQYLKPFRSIILKLIPYNIMIATDIIYIYDLINSGKGILSFVHIYNIMFPEFKKKIRLILITDTINSKYKLYYSSNNSIKIKKKLNKDKIKFKIINFKCNMYILSIFTQEIYNNRCFKSLSIDQICSKKFDGNIFEIYDKINLNNLIKFYIIDRNQWRLR
jgi:hypothetical protein